MQQTFNPNSNKTNKQQKKNQTKKQNKTRQKNPPKNPEIDLLCENQIVGTSTCSGAQEVRISLFAVPKSLNNCE